MKDGEDAGSQIKSSRYCDSLTVQLEKVVSNKKEEWGSNGDSVELLQFGPRILLKFIHGNILKSPIFHPPHAI